MTSNYVIMSIKVRLDVANNKNIILCNFGSRIKRCFEVIEGARLKTSSTFGCPFYRTFPYFCTRIWKLNPAVLFVSLEVKYVGSIPHKSLYIATTTLYHKGSMGNYNKCKRVTLTWQKAAKSYKTAVLLLNCLISYLNFLTYTKISLWIIYRSSL